NDVSWLFPAPTTTADLANLIAVKDITVSGGPVWTDAVFQQFVAIADSPTTQVAGTSHQISLPQEARSIDAWFVAGVRIDAGAPGLSKEIAAQYGQLPEIRLIIQPIVKSPDGSPKPLDIAGHLIFDFTTQNPDPSLQGTECFPRFVADMSAFRPVIADAAALRTKLANGQLGGHSVSTSGVPLGIHPGLADPVTANAVRNAMLAFLESHISSQRLGSMAIAGLPANAGAPWIFLSMLFLGPGVTPTLPNGGFVPVHGPTLDGAQFAQMLNPASATPRVVPEPATNNLNPITCRNAAASPTSLPVTQRKGVSTSTVFAATAPPADQTKQILDTIADPQKSFFFNTDCISCHTETQRAMTLLHVSDIPGINQAVLPSTQYDVRNFGWGAGKAGMQSTVTRRAANETTAVVTFINSNLLSTQQ
ncbi:MAG: hypothetical protein ABSC71_00990, partial [Candidatus Acidiferrales bacterium]